MLKHRVIPCLLLRNGGLVKTLKFADAKYVGDPINAIRIFNDKEVDELMVLDITASKDKKEPNYELIEQFASECFMPLTYGGGIKTMEQAQRLFNSGIEKICLQTSVLDDLSLVKSLSDKWGSSSILVSIDVKRNWMGQPKLYSAATGKTLDKKWTDYMLEAVKAGAGEIVLNAVDKDGTMKGMDTELINEAAKILSVPLVAVGGAGSLADIKAAVDAGANAVSAGALFVFQGPHRAVLITYPKYNELIQLLS
ncbi:AglZ/HisF2 family acetamidino modification protein [Flavobacterium sp.]|jgi:cyclase|uniref:AglZ/HisF2 family acetamidino modification protein n=1 Tax=Flavobacterium sp. TaxID=239 RepID=UPI0037C0FD59